MGAEGSVEGMMTMLGGWGPRLETLGLSPEGPSRTQSRCGSHPRRFSAPELLLLRAQ